MRAVATTAVAAWQLIAAVAAEEDEYRPDLRGLQRHICEQHHPHIPREPLAVTDLFARVIHDNTREYCRLLTGFTDHEFFRLADLLKGSIEAPRGSHIAAGEAGEGQQAPKRTRTAKLSYEHRLFVALYWLQSGMTLKVSCLVEFYLHCLCLCASELTVFCRNWSSILDGQNRALKRIYGISWPLLYMIWTISTGRMLTQEQSSSTAFLEVYSITASESSIAVFTQYALQQVVWSSVLCTAEKTNVIVSRHCQL